MSIDDELREALLAWTREFAKTYRVRHGRHLEWIRFHDITCVECTADVKMAGSPKVESNLGFAK